VRFNASDEPSLELNSSWTEESLNNRKSSSASTEWKEGYIPSFDQYQHEIKWKLLKQKELNSKLESAKIHHEKEVNAVDESNLDSAWDIILPSDIHDESSILKSKRKKKKKKKKKKKVIQQVEEVDEEEEVRDSPHHHIGTSPLR